MDDFVDGVDRVLSEISFPGSGDEGGEVLGSGDEMKEAFNLLWYLMVPGKYGKSLFEVFGDITEVFQDSIVDKVESGDAPMDPGVLLDDLKKLLTSLEMLDSLSGECHRAVVDLAGKISG